MMMTSHPRPNILIFVTDDHAAWAAGCYGYPQLSTPSFDFLAQSGYRFNQAFTPSPVCSPARACLYTGLMPAQHGIHDYLEEYHHPGAHPGLAGKATLAHHLRSAGYQTAHIGKWHCGHSWQRQAGFDHWVSRPEGNNHVGNAARGPMVFHHAHGDTHRVNHHSGRHDEVVTRYALDFLDHVHGSSGQHDAPFLLSIGLTDTHSPFCDMPERLVHRHRATAPPAAHMQRVMDACHGTYGSLGQDEWDARPEWIAQYFAAAEAVDANVGRIIDHLESTGQLENTLVIYTSDHGHMTGRHGLITKGNATNPQNFIDDSIRVPLLVRWPQGGVEAGRVCNEMVTHCDTYRSILDAAQAADASLDADIAAAQGPGLSYLPLLRGEDFTQADAVFLEYGDAKCVRTPTHKLVIRESWAGRSHPDALYDLEQDPWERVNVIHKPQHDALVKKLRKRAAEFWRRYADDQHTAQAISQAPYQHNGHEVWTK